MDWQNRNCEKTNRNRSDEFQTILTQFCPSIIKNILRKIDLQNYFGWNDHELWCILLMINSFEAENLSTIDRVVLASVKNGTKQGQNLSIGVSFNQWMV